MKANKTGLTGSNPSLSAIKQLITNRLTTVVACKIAQDLRVKFEGPFLFEPNTELNKWHVWLKYRHPVTDKFERFRFWNGFSDYKTKALKREYGKKLKEVFTKLLKEGWSPYEEFSGFLKQDDRICSLIDQYLLEVAGNIRPSTLIKYKSELTLFKTYLQSNGMGFLSIKNVTKNIIANFLNYYKIQRSWSAKTYNHYINDITVFFNYYESNYDDVIEVIPSAKMKRLAVVKKGNSSFSDYQLKKIKELMKDNGDDFLYTFCSFVYYGALRNTAECILIRAKDFDFKNKTLRIDSDNSKNRKTEFIPLYPDFLELLYELEIDKLDPELYVFGKPKKRGAIFSHEFSIGGKYPIGHSYFTMKFKPYKEALGIPDGEHGIYRFKHTRAVHLGQDGEELYKIQKLFRHGTLAITMVYMRDLGVDTQNVEYKKGRSF